MQNQIEIARIMLHMTAEYEAGKRISGKLPQDMQEYFIARRVENMQHCQEQLITLVGQEQASQIIAEVGL